MANQLTSHSNSPKKQVKATRKIQLLFYALHKPVPELESKRTTQKNMLRRFISFLAKTAYRYNSATTQS